MTRAFLLVSLAWAVGLTLAVVLGLLLGVTVPGPAATIASPLVLGLVVGAAQRRALGKDRTGRAFALLSGAGATAGWLLGTLVAWRLFTLGAGSIAPWVDGPVAGAVLGALQCAALHGSAREKALWVSSSAVAWGLAIGPWLDPSAPAWLRFVALAIPGIFGALVARARETKRAASPPLLAEALAP